MRYLLLLFIVFALVSFIHASESSYSSSDCSDESFESDIETGGSSLSLDDFRIEDYNDPIVFKQVSIVQFEHALRIHLTILCAFLFAKATEPIYKFLGLVSILSLPIQLMYYFGYYFFLRTCSLERIKYANSKRYVSFNCWLFTPLSWVTECLLLMSDEEYAKFQPYLPTRNNLTIIFFFQFLHYLGVFDSLYWAYFRRTTTRTE